MKIEISKEDLAFIQDLAKELSTQNNRATAKPYFYVVKMSKKITGLAPGLGDDQEWVNTYSGEYESYNSPAEAKKAIKEEYGDISDQEVDKIFDEHYEQYGYTYSDDKEENVFLTKKGFDEHMRLNAHNYPGKQDGDRGFKESDACFSYVKHAFRNPEMKRLIEIIETLGKANVEP